MAETIEPIGGPDNIIFTPDLPKSRSNQIMRQLLRDVTRRQVLRDVTIGRGLCA